MSKKKFDRLSYASVWQQIDAYTKNLAGGSVSAEIAAFDITTINDLTITLDVSIAALKKVEIKVRGDTQGRWFTIEHDQLDGYGRTDNGMDINTTPVGEACFIMLNCRGWSDVVVTANSDGAAKIVVSAGGQ